VLAEENVKPLHILIVTIVLSINLVFAQSDVTEKLITTYPYYASEKRSVQIKNKYKQIKQGMTSKQVIQLLGDPDEIRPLYEPKIWGPKQIGYSYWYLIQRKTDKGSQNDRDEKLVRVSYDLDWDVMFVDHWGFDEQPQDDITFSIEYRAEVVLRVKRLSFDGSDKHAWYTVKISKVIKNTSGEVFGTTLKIASYSWKRGIPEGESTVYLQHYNKSKKKFWMLLGGEAATGVRHMKNQ